MSFEQCQRMTSFMSGFNKPWFFAGGWAIDLFIGRETRPHQDMEIALFRSDQLILKEYLKDWDFKKVVKGRFYPWGNEFLELPIHELYALNTTNGDELEVLLNEEKDGAWTFRRDRTITHPLKSVWSYSDTGIPYLNPEIVLLYKVKNTREKDHQDFMSIVDLLDDERKQWLRNAIQLHEPEHTWLRFLL
ncbi:nucleotidyltransferase domain-containing protein [Peribacillus sp. NPDC097295]|uniref:nucleotidyltransferase domain-containing protein n=1 Tax=Peribacillus sp. NPDC097295 TaxID=3364402 RepID=UPI0037FFBC0F